MDLMQADFVAWAEPTATHRAFGRFTTREQLIAKLQGMAGQGNLSAGLAALTEHVGARNYLLTRYDLSQDNSLNFVVCSDWPFDIVRRLTDVMISLHTRSTEYEKCLSVLQPVFAVLPPDVHVQNGVSRDYCATTFNVGRVRYCLMLLLPENVILSQESLREVSLLAGYFASFSFEHLARDEREFELTERELECLSWIAEGKTSDEIAVILGISRNTINNYITSVMRKTATKTRSEAIAFAVRNNLV